VKFYVTSSDVVHGFEIAQTDVNIMAIPGWVNSASHRFTKPGTYLLVCNEYCGIGHQNMYGTIEVK
jgi:cytochrome c oxidase subunit II